MSSQKNIVVVGAAFAGLQMAHNILKHTLPSLNASSKDYHLYLVNPSTHFYYRIAAPRAIVSSDLLDVNKAMFPIEENFKQYDQATFHFVQAFATSLDTTTRTLTIRRVDGETTEDIPYHALVIATGTRTPSPLLSLHGEHTKTLEAIDTLHKRLPNAKTVIIGGGGPAGVESAGEIGEFLNGYAGNWKTRPANPKAKITLITSESKLIPILRPALGKQAEAYLNKMGVDVIYSKRIAKVEPAEEHSHESPVTITLEDGTTMSADVYIAATGVKPNTEWLPKSLLNDRGYVKTNHGTLRVEGAGPNVYAVGDVADYGRGGVMDIGNAFGVAGNNLKQDLLAPATDEKGGAAHGKDKTHKAMTAEFQIVPVGKGRGVGAMFGWKMPSMMVAMIKGKDYFLSMAPPVVKGTKA